MLQNIIMSLFFASSPNQDMLVQKVQDSDKINNQKITHFQNDVKNDNYLARFIEKSWKDYYDKREKSAHPGTKITIIDKCVPNLYDKGWYGTTIDEGTSNERTIYEYVMPEGGSMYSATIELNRLLNKYSENCEPVSWKQLYNFNKSVLPSKSIPEYEKKIPERVVLHWTVKTYTDNGIDGMN